MATVSVSLARSAIASLPRRSHALLVGCLLAGALLLRLDGITSPSLESRELHNALIARQFYLGDGDGLPAWKRHVLRELREVVRPIEPPVLDTVAASAFRLAGEEELWIPRLLSALLWLLGGVFLYLIANRVTTRGGAIVALAAYLFWPYAVWLSRLYMPDAMMVALLLGAALAVIRYWERPSPSRLVAAGAVSALATAVKPGVALIFLGGLFVALAVSKRALLSALLRGPLPVFVTLAAIPAAAYYVYGTYVRDFLAGESAGRVEPELVATAWFWEGWWEMLSIVLAFPQRQEYLALAPLAAALAGIVSGRRGTPRAVLVGLSAGYLVFALLVPGFTATHAYYALPLVPILALSVGALTGFLLERLGAQGSAARFGLVALVALGVGVAAFKSHAVLTGDRSYTHRQIADYRRIGELTGHTTRAVYVDLRLRSPISYWGWMVGRYWYPPTPAEDLPASGDPFPERIDPEKVSFLIVTEMSELDTERRLRAFTRNLPVVARTSRYAVFDLRGGRALAAVRSSASEPG
jgi:4-amino-4-deoxy-L-arabinose transferase-like glycosyltransferase